ncbi:MAG: mechanosensitive ion channel [Burkholderiaceae bacterium]
MNTERLLHSMLLDFWRDLQQPSVVWQILALAACLVVAWAGSSALLRRWRREALSRVTGVDPAVAATAAALAAEAGGGTTDNRVAAEVDQASHGLFGRLQAREAIARLLFPLFSLGLLGIVRLVMDHWMATNVLRLAIVMTVAMVLVRTIVYVVSSVSRSSMLVAFERSLVSLVWGAVALHVTGYADDVVMLLRSLSFPVGAQTLDAWTLLSSAFWILATVLAAVWLGGLVEARLLAAASIDVSLRAVLSRLIQSLFLIVALLMGFSIVGIDLSALSVFGGALGVGIGLGLQRIASNYISGFVVLLERQIRLGDQVRIDAVQGTVKDIRTRFTLIEAGNGAIHIMPNDSLVGSVVQNFSRSGRLRLSLPIQVAYGADLEQASRLAVDAARATPRVLADPPPSVSLARFDPDGISLEVSFSLADPHNGQGRVLSDVAMAIWPRFREAGIEVPASRREVRGGATNGGSRGSSV